MKKKNAIILTGISLASVIVFSLATYYISYQKHYAPMEKYEISCLTNAAYRLSDRPDRSAGGTIEQIMHMRGNSKYEDNVVDVLELNPRLFGYWGEDDILRPKNVNEQKYYMAEKAVQDMIEKHHVAIED